MFTARSITQQHLREYVKDNYLAERIAAQLKHQSSQLRCCVGIPLVLIH